MKKRVSLILVLVMIVSAFGSFAFATTPASTAFEQLVASTLVSRILGLSTDNKLQIATAIIALDDQNIVVDGIIEALDLPALAGLKQRLNNNGADRDAFEAIANELTALRQSFNVIGSIGLLTQSISTSTALSATYDGGNQTTVGELIEAVYSKMHSNAYISDMNDKLNEKLISGTKVNLLLDVANALVNNMNLTKSGTTYNVSVTNASLETGLNNIVQNYFGGSVPGITTAEVNALASFIQTKAQNRLNDGTFTTEQKDAMVAAVAAIKQSGSSGGDGVFVPAPTPQPTPVEVVVTDGAAQAAIPSDAVTVTTGTNGVVVVKVDQTKVMAAIDSIIEKLKEADASGATVAIELSDVTTANLEVSLPTQLMQKLVDNNINLVINTPNVALEVPANALEGTFTAADNTVIEFKSIEVSIADIQGLVPAGDFSKIAKVFQFGMQVKNASGAVVRQLSRFNSTVVVTVDIEEADGNPDLLGGYYINETTGRLEFVGGKIKGNKITLRTNHFSKFAILESNKTYADIEGHWAKDYVKSMIAKNVVSGYTDNTYRPEASITRAEFLKLLLVALEVETTSYTGNFTDVTAQHWAKDYVQTAKNLGITDGYEDNTFRPEQAISRAEIATMVARALKLNTSKVSYTNINKFVDANQIPAWAINSFAAAVNENILTGYTNNALNPVANMTRAEAATVIYRVFNK